MCSPDVRFEAVGTAAVWPISIDLSITVGLVIASELTATDSLHMGGEFVDALDTFRPAGAPDSSTQEGFDVTTELAMPSTDFS